MKPQYFIIALLCPFFSMCQTIPVTGTIINEQGEPVPSATITLKRTKQSTTSDSKGHFTFDFSLLSDTFIVSAIGYQTTEEPNNERGQITIILKQKITELDQVLIQAYGTTTRRLNTGSIAKLSGEDIRRQPVSNPLAALQGRIPGLVITQTSGVPGSSFNVEIRGRSSLDLSLSRNDPLFIIDGVPFEPGNLPASQLVSAANKPRSTNEGGLSPLNTINPADIESIEVLKDADATAIYGSRGAGGVILITTKKGVVGKTSVAVNTSAGFSRAARTMDMLTTAQYLSMRREAMANDGFTPQKDFPYSDGYAPDLLVWDTTVFIDYKKELIGNTAHSSDAQLSLSGGNSTTRFLMAGNFHRETNLFSRSLTDNKAGLHFNISHSSANKKFSASLAGFYTSDKNNLLQKDLTQFLNLPPNFKMYNNAGHPNWVQDGILVHNLDMSFASIPAAELLKKYKALNENLSSNLLLSYSILPGLVAKASLGYNRFLTDENSIIPKAALSPQSNELASSNFAKSSSSGWIIEPQLHWSKKIAKGIVTLLAGTTLQERKYSATSIASTNYTNDLLLTSLDAAGLVNASNSYSQYRYTAFFGRFNYNWQNKYILNLTGRRDGSSRFGPGNRFANFSSIGMAWIFSDEPFFKKLSNIVSFGKLRASYGSTGNDQIGDYKYLDRWRAAFNTYQGYPGLVPSALYNPNYQWEFNKKLEVAIEWGFIRDRIFLSAAYYRNRSNNQLVSFKLPNQSGFSSIIQNLPALVQNTGLEFSLTSKNFTTNKFNWTTSFNLTFPRNKLVSFPGLAESGYAAVYKEGLPLSIFSGFNHLGVDPATGVYTVQDINNDGQFDNSDYKVPGNTDPKYYGGIQNSFTYRSFELSLFFEGRKQLGKNYLASLLGNQPGLATNQPVGVLDRWRHPGDITTVQKFSSSYSGTAAFGAYYFRNSNAIYTDASFIRLKTIYAAYNIPSHFLKKANIESLRIYLQAQNLFTITSYLGSDPETQDILVLPPLKTIAFGIQLKF
ncbi:SusC/RagA family TonB-linked outer membrane protein [Terrimonas pollutisoli]|uniref:SusC/RagA family TonB-linked outer membrane protein n=1 Tax=Terrimonas pollutisoli TaxID=3034147 RepID=UPI0023EB6DBD|nr:SusC/RagA family TonB-linked outer membrane protein [Terrimonas sp. H1YJ31]